jgi:hypothetical protein
VPRLRSMNMTSAAHTARLLPSGRGWFQASRQTRTAAHVSTVLTSHRTSSSLWAQAVASWGASREPPLGRHRRG